MQLQDKFLAFQPGHYDIINTYLVFEIKTTFPTVLTMHKIGPIQAIHDHLQCLRGFTGEPKEMIPIILQMNPQIIRIQITSGKIQ